MQNAEGGSPNVEAAGEGSDRGLRRSHCRPISGLFRQPQSARFGGGRELGNAEGRTKNAEVEAQSEHRLVSGVPAGLFAVTGPTWSLRQREL